MSRKEIGLKTSAHVWTSCWVIALGLVPIAAVAQAPMGACGTTWMAAWGGLPAPSRAEADDLLRQARSAFEQGKFDLAESYLNQVQGLGVNYQAYEPGDTPMKLRQDLAEARKMARPLPGDSGAMPMSNPPRDAAGNSPYGIERISYQTSTGGSSAAALADSDRLLVEARRALAKGDLLRCDVLLKQAETLGVNYQVYDDSPSQVRGTLGKAQALQSEQARGNSSSDLYRRQYADLLMEQSKALLRWNILEEAERLASDARGLNVRYNTF